jgi:hypothetical protein
MSLRFAVAKRASKLSPVEVQTIQVPSFDLPQPLVYPKSIFTGFNAPVLASPDAINRATAVNLNVGFPILLFGIFHSSPCFILF